jgi:hypothetical protein
MTTLRTATNEDFKVGTTLISKTGGWKFTLTKKYSDGVWESREKAIFEDEAEFYNIEITK